MDTQLNDWSLSVATGLWGDLAAATTTIGHWEADPEHAHWMELGAQFFKEV